MIAVINKIVLITKTKKKKNKTKNKLKFHNSLIIRESKGKKITIIN